GIGRAPGSDQRTARVLRHGPGPLGIEHFPRQVQDVVAFLHDDLAPEHPWRGIHAMPSGASVPEVWLLGSSDESALLAAQLGTAFCFAHFINAQGGAEVTRAYRERFSPSPDLGAPRSSVAVFAVCAETEIEARRLARSRDLFIVRLYTGRPGPYPSVEEAESYPYNAQELAIAEHAGRRSVVGTPEQVRERLLGMAADYQADELIVVTITHDFKARLRSYELLADAFELSRP
ncbi:MAG: MsnO8 family LLM class oxidoreductase, partial [Candidatus Rokuibacteriota bacterium]